MQRFLFTAATVLSIAMCHAQTADSFLDPASDHFEANEFDACLNVVEQGLEVHPQNIHLMAMKGAALSETGEYQTAYDVLTEAMDLYPDSAILYGNRGLLLMTVKEYDASLNDFNHELVKSVSPFQELIALSHLGTLRLYVRDFENAEEVFLEALKIDSNDIAVLNNLANIYGETGRSEQAIAMLERIVELDPDFTATYSNLGFEYQNMGNHETAINYFNRALAFQKDDAVALNNRGLSHLALGKTRAAMKDINRSIKLYPANPYAYRNRALVYLRSGKTEDACTDLNTALDKDFTVHYGNEVEDLIAQHCTEQE